MAASTSSPMAAAAVLLLLSLAALSDARRVVARFGADGVSGTVSFEQQRIYTPTTVNVQLSGLAGLAGGYHIHILPVPSPGACGATGGHYNPYGVPTDQCSTTDTSVCEVGDLSGRFGALTGLQSINEMYMAEGIALFGPYSIVGRSVVIHKATGERWVCADIEYPSDVFVAQANFVSGPVKGTVTFRQPLNSGTTTAVVDVMYADATATPSAGHKWHIHEKPVSGGDCASTGGHYNPASVCLTSTCGYSANCGPGQMQYGCEVGDLAGKGGTLTIGTTSAPTFVTFIDLPLHGSSSIVGRSITIHAESGGAPRMACATISMVSSASSPSSSNDGEIVGIFFGVVVGLGVVVAALAWFRKRARDERLGDSHVQSMAQRISVDYNDEDC